MTPDQAKAKAELERAIAVLIDGLSPVESALLLAETFREATGDKWKIEARPDGTFAVIDQTE